MSRYCAQRYLWWPLVLALFALSAFAAIALAAGTAHADEASPATASNSQSDKPEKSGKVEKPAKLEKPATVEKRDDPEPATGHPGATEPATAPADTDTETDADPAAAKPEPKTDGPSIIRHTPTVVKRDPPTPKTVDDTPAAEPTPPKTPASTIRSDQSERHLRSVPTVETAKDAATASSTTVEVANVTKSTTPTTATANVVALPTAPTKIAATPTLDQQFAQFVRQLVGLTSDAGIVGASLVNNLAVQAAAIIGPQAFWGVPYHLATGIADTAANVSKVLSGTPLDATSTGPFTVDYGVSDVLAFLNPTKAPAGANDPSIRVTAAHPLPVILLNGTIATQGVNWSVGAPVLANAGYKVYSYNYGNVTPFPNFPIQSTADIAQSAAQLSVEINRVLTDTGAPKVILIGHSQGGGILPSYYLNVLGGADKVSQLIGLAPSNHGTDLDGLAGLLALPVLGPLLAAATDLIGPALGQQTVSSPFQQVVYGGGDTQPGVLYTTIASTNDEIVTPYTQQALEGGNVTNIVLQDHDPGSPLGHLGVVFSSQAWEAVLGALAANPQANPLSTKDLVAA